MNKIGKQPTAPNKIELTPRGRARVTKEIGRAVRRNDRARAVALLELLSKARWVDGPWPLPALTLPATIEQGGAVVQAAVPDDSRAARLRRLTEGTR